MAGDWYRDLYPDLRDSSCLCGAAALALGLLGLVIRSAVRSAVRPNAPARRRRPGLTAPAAPATYAVTAADDATGAESVHHVTAATPADAEAYVAAQGLRVTWVERA